MGTYSQKMYESNKKWRERNPEKVKEYARKSKLKITYGMTLEDYDNMLEKQNGGCAICGVTENTYSRWPEKYLAVDHDHKTGENRGLLCDHCNRGIGMFNDDPDLLVKASKYLTKL